MFKRKRFGFFTARHLLTLALIWPVVGWSVSARAASVFSLLSSPQSWIGGGRPVLVTQEDGLSFSGYTDSASSATFSINDFDGRSGRSVASFWLLELAAPDDRPLTPGIYENAKKYPFQGSSFPGINFEGNGLSNSYVTGSFEIYELVARPDGAILSFAADFLQYDEGIASWWNRGSLRINSARPLTSLEPPSVVAPPPPPPPLEDPILMDPPPGVGRGPDSGGPGRNLPPEDPWDPAPEPPPLIGSPGAQDPVPGPMSVAAALMGWQASRNLRRRCRSRP